MPSKRVTIFYLALIIFIGLCVEGLLVVILLLSRDELINHIVALTKRPYLLSILQSSIISPQKFLLIRWACYALLAINPLFVLLLCYYRKRIISFLLFIKYCLTSSFKSISAIFKNNSRRANAAFLFLLLIIIARAVYYIIHFELQYDEMWSYNYFTSRPFYLSFFTYNNYPLFELSTQLFKWLPFSMKINLRLPCLLAGISSCIVLYACIKKYSGHSLTALAGVAIFACMPVSTFYMLYARGVMFELFFAIISIFSVLYLLKGSNAKKYLTIFVIANVAGIYSMPTHIYFLLLQGLLTLVYTIWFKKTLTVPFLLNNVLIVLLSFICYLPVITGSGLSFVFNPAPNPALVNQTIPDLIFYNKGINTFFTGYFNGFAILFTATLLIIALFKKLNRPYLFFIVAIVMLGCLPSAIYLVQGTAISERALAFIGLVIPICFCLVFYALKDNVTKYTLNICLVAFFIAGCVSSHQQSFMNWSASQDKKAITISNLLMQNHVSTCYDNANTSNFYYYYPALEYYYGQQHQSININMSTPNSLRYKKLLPADNYDCIVNNISLTDTLLAKKYTTVYTDIDGGFKMMILKR